MPDFSGMTLEQLEAANADLQARRLESQTAFKEEITALAAARTKIESEAKAKKLVSDMDEATRLQVVELIGIGYRAEPPPDEQVITSDDVATINLEGEG